MKLMYVYLFDLYFYLLAYFVQQYKSTVAYSQKKNLQLKKHVEAYGIFNFTDKILKTFF